MSDFFSLLFSPCGCVGRGTWWGMHICYAIIGYILLFSFVIVVGNAGEAASLNNVGDYPREAVSYSCFASIDCMSCSNFWPRVSQP